VDQPEFVEEHLSMVRRYFLKIGFGGLSACSSSAMALVGDDTPEKISKPQKRSKPDKAGARREPYFTPPEDFRDVSRGKPLPHSWPEEKKREVGLTRDTWKLEVISDPDRPATLGKQLTKAEGSAIDRGSMPSCCLLRPLGVA